MHAQGAYAIIRRRGVLRHGDAVEIFVVVVVTNCAAHNAICSVGATCDASVWRITTTLVCARRSHDVVRASPRQRARGKTQPPSAPRKMLPAVSYSYYVHGAGSFCGCLVLHARKLGTCSLVRTSDRSFGLLLVRNSVTNSALVVFLVP